MSRPSSPCRLCQLDLTHTVAEHQLRLELGCWLQRPLPVGLQLGRAVCRLRRRRGG